MEVLLSSGQFINFLKKLKIQMIKRFIDCSLLRMYTANHLLNIKGKVYELLSNICPSHGYIHAITVMTHCEKASQYLDPKTKFLVTVAGLLHDVDDKKFFPKNDNYQNLILAMQGFDSDDIKLVKEMVGYVSCSVNGNTIPERAIENPWLLYPRHADRLEAIGKIGIARCYKYTKSNNTPLFLESTPRPQNEDDLWTNIATETRYQNYKGNSKSFIDHFYDKLLRVYSVDTQNSYFEGIKKEQTQILIDFVLEFGRIGTLNVEELEQMVNELL
jgi:uncharacterized protein